MITYAQAVQPNSHTVLGVRLRPYCIGHALILERHQSPLVLNPVPWDRVAKADILFAVFVCSHSYEAALKHQTSFYGCLLMRWIAWRCRKMPLTVLIDKCARFVDYLREHSKSPELWDKGSKGRDGGAPWLAQLRVTLLRRLHYSDTAAMNLPLCQAQLECCVHWELEGLVELIDENDPLLLEHKKLKAEQAAKAQ